MHPLLSVGALSRFGTPESIAVLVILLIFFSGRFEFGSGDSRLGFDARLTPREQHILIFVGAVTTIGVAIIMWHKRAL